MARNSGDKSVSNRRVSSSSVKESLLTAISSTERASLSALRTFICSTSSGSSRRIWLTASRTSAATTSKSTPGRNSIEIRALFSSLDERMDSTPETRAAAPSNILVTSASTVSGAPPGKVALTPTTGRSTSGSSRTSTPIKAAIPAMAISTLRTTISTGRRIDTDGKSFASCWLLICWSDIIR